MFDNNQLLTTNAYLTHSATAVQKNHGPAHVGNSSYKMYSIEKQISVPCLP